jgi:hypothetical protein
MCAPKTVRFSVMPILPIRGVAAPEALILALCEFQVVVDFQCFLRSWVRTKNCPLF